MGLYACGLSHHSAPVALRESLAMSQDRTTAFLQQLKHQNVANEVVVLATCNRFEMYVQAPTPDALLPQLARYCDVDIALLKPHWYCHSGQNATEHLMQVVSGIDSMVIGESQISAQVKKAFADAKSAGVLGSHLHYLFERVLSVSKQVRSYTPIGAPVISVAYLVIELAKRFFDDFSEKPANSKLDVFVTSSNVEIIALPMGLKGGDIFGVFWILFISLWTILVLYLSILGALFSIPFWIAGFFMNRKLSRKFEKQYIEKVLRATENNKTKAAEILGIDRKTIRTKLED